MELCELASYTRIGFLVWPLRGSPLSLVMRLRRVRSPWSFVLRLRRVRGPWSVVDHEEALQLIS